MKRIKGFLNSDDTLLVVTSYPDPEHGIRDLNAVAWYAQKTLRALSKKQRVIVLAEKIGGDKNKVQNGNLTVFRTWKKGNPLSLFSIIFYVFKYFNVENVLFQFEFNIFGGILPVLAVPVIIAILKLLNKHVYFEFHQVVFDVAKLEKHINIKNRLVQKTLNFGLEKFYRIIGALSDKIIVLESALKDKLATVIDEEKIVVLPITVERKKTIGRVRAKKMLGLDRKDFVVLVFGFINWYKGSDWVASAMGQRKGSRIKLVLAGGQNPTLKDKEYYQRFYSSLQASVKKYKNVFHTEFVPDNQIAQYFSAADLVVLPYRIFISASGPFSLALSYRKPVILSKYLSPYTESLDFSYALKQLDLQKSDVFFSLRKNSLMGRVQKAKNDRKFMRKLLRFSEILADRRKTETLIKDYQKIVSRYYTIQPTFALRFNK